MKLYHPIFKKNWHISCEIENGSPSEAPLFLFRITEWVDIDTLIILRLPFFSYYRTYTEPNSKKFKHRIDFDITIRLDIIERLLSFKPRVTKKAHLRIHRW